MKTLYTTYNNFAKRFAVILTILMTISINNVWAAATQYTGKIIFGNNGTKINAASVTGDDDLENTWTITTVGTTSYTASGEYHQVGSKSNPATTITFTTTLSENYKIVAFSANFGGFSETAGAITLKVGDIEVGTGSLSGQNDVTIKNSKEATGKTLTVAVTGISRAVKCYSISYTYESISQVSHEVTWRANGEIYKTESLPEGNMTLGQLPNKPSNCNNSIVFVGWTAQQEVNVTKPADLFNSETPGNLPMINKPSTFYAVYAEMIEGDGSFIYGSNGEYKIYANVNGTYHYAKERADNGLKITSTTTKANAGTFIFDLHNVDGNLYYTIQFKDIENQYIYYSKSTDLELRDEPYYWNIVPSSQNKGTWRVTSVEDSPRSIIYQTNSFNTFGGYDCANITADGNFYDLEIGNGEAISYQNYTTTCTTDVTVTLNPNGGTGDFNGWDEVYGNYTKTVEKGNSVILPTLNDQTAYTFGGWSDGTTTHNAGTYTPETDVELTAVWQAKPLINFRTLCTYEIILKNNYVDDDSKDGLATITSTHTAFSTFTAPSAREGYSIEGYYAESECTTKVVNSDKTLISNVTNYTDADGKWIGGETTLYTKWTGRTYTVTLDDNGGSGGSGTITATYGSPMPEITLPTRTGYTFNGYWTGKTTQSTQYYDANGSSLKNWDKAGNTTTLYALWTANTNTPYVVEHYKQQLDGTYPPEADDTDNLTGTTASSVTPEVKSYEGFTAPSTQTVSIAADGSTVVTYQYTRNSYNLSWDVNSGDALTGEYTSGSVKYGASITQPNTPTRIGYTFANWSPEVPATMPAGDATYTAQWQLIQYTITWSVGGSTTTSIVSVETPLSLPTSPANNALGCCADAFIGWSVYAQPTKEQVFNDVANAPEIDENKTFYAVFATTTLTEGSATATFNEMGYTNAEKVTEIALGDGEGHGDATILFAKDQSASNYPAYYTASGALHAYAKNTITINSTSATSTITNVQFTFAAKEDGSNTISANVGTYADGTWSGSAESVVFTIGGETGHRKITSITVTTQAVEQYTNYVTKCIYGNSPTLGAATVTYNSGDGIDVRCEQTSTMNKAATLTFPNAADLTCPITLTASAGFLISTSKSNDAGYQTSLTVSPYKSGSAQAGKLRTIYVRANAIGKTENYSGTITISGGEVAEQTITVNANVNCQGYTLTLKDHLGNTIGTPTAHYEGDIIELPTELKEDACSENYTFDGWSTAPVEYGSLIYNKVSFLYTMPAANVTLYPVYQCNKTADYHRVTSDLGANNWAGDYLIAANDQTFANGGIGGMTADNSMGYENVKVDLSNYISNDIVSGTIGDTYNVALVPAEGGGYLLQTKDKKYNYFSNNNNNGLNANTMASVALPYAMSIDFISENEINMKLSGDAIGSVFRYRTFGDKTYFRFYQNGATSNNPIYLYKKSPLYTTSLICEEVTASDALVTSTADQTVKVNVPITLTSSLHRTTDITAESDNSHFTITNLSDIEEGNHTLAVHYRPTVTTDGIETANIKIKVNNLPVNTFQVTGRHLPENFVIAAKAGGEWVALTAKVSNGTQVAVPIIVDDKTAPTKAIVALNTCQYKLLGLTTKNRFDVNGTAVHLYSTQTEKVLNASTASGTSTYLNTDATHDNAEISDNALFYEWQLVTEDLKKYTITNSNTTNTSNTRLGYSAATGQWGMYVNNVNVNQELYLLPIESHFTELNVEVMEWGTNSMALRIDGTAPSKLDVTLGENTNTVTLANLNSGNISDIYKAEGIDLTTNDCEIMKIVDNANPNSGTLIRKPILVNTTEAVSSTYRTKLNDDYCAHCDIVILKDAKLTADQGIHDHTSFAKIYVYPGGKLVLDAKSLGVKQQVYLRGGYSWLNSKYALPELYLNGTIDFNGSGNIIYDYYIKNYQYYQFSLPYDVQLAKVTDEAGIDNFPVWVKHYNGALRAADPHATSWEWYPSENGDAKAYFKAGEGYIIAAQPRQVGNTANRPLSIIRFPLGNKAFNSTNGIETDLTITTIAHGIDGYNAGTVTANNVGWNFIGNPFMATWKGDIGYKQLAKHPDENNWDGTYHWVDSDVKYITIMSAESGSDYKQYIASNTELKPFFPFYLQETAVGRSGEITFATSQRIQKAPAMLLSEQPRKAFIQIEIIAEEEIDQTGLFVCDKYSDDIDFDDYEKLFGSSIDKPKLWLLHEDKRMAFEAMTESTAATYIPLGYRAPKIGKYIFAINEEASKVSEVEAVYLTDNQTGVTDFDLLSSAYEFESNGELYNDSRFTIRIVLRDESSSTVTGVDNVLHFNSDHPYKFIYQDKMYILRNGVIYDAMGKQVQTINK